MATFVWKKALVIVGFASLPSMASAALIATIAGNDCSGVFGQGFSNCKIPEQYDPNESPIIIKFDFSDSGIVTNIEINSTLFTTIDGSEFSFVMTGQGTGTWTYVQGLGDPNINFFVAKGGPNFNLFSTGGLSDSFVTPTNPNNGNPFGLSHLSFYDTGGQVPEPAPLALIGLGLVGLMVTRRRRNIR